MSPEVSAAVDIKLWANNVAVCMVNRPVSHPMKVCLQ